MGGHKLLTWIVTVQCRDVRFFVMRKLNFFYWIYLKQLDLLSLQRLKRKFLVKMNYNKNCSYVMEKNHYRKIEHALKKFSNSTSESREKCVGSSAKS